MPLATFGRVARLTILAASALTEKKEEEWVAIGPAPTTPQELARGVSKKFLSLTKGKDQVSHDEKRSLVREWQPEEGLRWLCESGFARDKDLFSLAPASHTLILRVFTLWIFMSLLAVDHS